MNMPRKEKDEKKDTDEKEKKAPGWWTIFRVEVLASGSVIMITNMAGLSLGGGKLK